MTCSSTSRCRENARQRQTKEIGAVPRWDDDGGCIHARLGSSTYGALSQRSSQISKRSASQSPTTFRGICRRVAISVRDPSGSGAGHRVAGVADQLRGGGIECVGPAIGVGEQVSGPFQQTFERWRLPSISRHCSSASSVTRKGWVSVWAPMSMPSLAASARRLPDVHPSVILAIDASDAELSLDIVEDRLDGGGMQRPQSPE